MIRDRTVLLFLKGAAIGATLSVIITVSLPIWGILITYFLRGPDIAMWSILALIPLSPVFGAVIGVIVARRNPD